MPSMKSIMIHQDLTPKQKFSALLAFVATMYKTPEEAAIAAYLVAMYSVMIAMEMKGKQTTSTEELAKYLEGIYDRVLSLAKELNDNMDKEFEENLLKTENPEVSTKVEELLKHFNPGVTH